MKQLSSNELLNLLGGDSITVEEYCAQLKEIFKVQVCATTIVAAQTL